MLSGLKSYWPNSWTGDVNDGSDIAVVKLNKETNLTLPLFDQQGGEFPEGESFTTLGWGEDENGNHPTTLQMTSNLQYVNEHDCKEYLEDSVKNHSICAGLRKQNTCYGLEYKRTAF